MNLVLLCHGALSEFGSFELGADQEVQYRGNFGESLEPPVAAALFKALVQNPTVTERQIATQISGYHQEPVLAGPRSVKPDIKLWATTSPPCFVMDLTTRQWGRLAPTFRSTLGQVVRGLGAPLHLDLLCCTELPDFKDRAVVDPALEVKTWAQIFQ
ncbi:hypothetical protein C8N24_6598 [Solirubrobacter pauli]|uniref:Uncharacterized protein n=1 Tax=Solirubrobacter pauli TaxID=166793 RepID=A0A660L286_9ACTN|nr:hypothetical protein [Solirubrobacter pauli]RKQ84967.1 hypothetical protein C8N24_6598 [Solirubrobacter pauli]